MFWSSPRYKSSNSPSGVIHSISYESTFIKVFDWVISEYFLQDDEKLLFGLDLIKKSFDNYFMYLTNNYNYLEFYRSKLNDEQFEYLKQLFRIK